MTDQQIYDQLGSDPQFAQLSYEAQTNVRSKLASGFLAADPNFQALSPDAKKLVYNKYVFAPPVLTDKNLQQAVESMSSLAEKGDKSAINVLGNLALTQGMVRGGLVSRLAVEATNTINKVMGVGQGGSVLAPLGGVDSSAQIVGADSNRISDYLGYLGSSDARMAKIVGAQKSGQLLGNLGDMVPMFVSFPNAIGKAVFTAFGETIADQTPHIMMRVFGRSILPQISESLTAGAAGAMQNILLSKLNSDDGQIHENFARLAAASGSAMALDFLIGTAGREVLPIAFGFGKAIFGKSLKTAELPKTMEEVNALIEKSKTMSNVDPAVRDSIEGWSKDMVWFRDQYQKAIGRGLQDLNNRPLDKTLIAAQAFPDVALRALDDGSFSMWHVASDQASTGIVHAQLPNLQAANDELARLAWSRYSGLRTAAQKSAYLSDHNQWLKNYATTLGGLDDALSSVPSQGGKFIQPAKRSFVSTGEANAISNAVKDNGGVVMRTRIDLSDEELVKRIANNQSPLPPGQSAQFTQNLTEPNAVVVVANPANEDVVRQAMGGRITKEGLVAARQNLIEAGYDGVVVNGKAITFFPEQVKWISPGVNKAGRLNLKKPSVSRVSTAVYATTGIEREMTAAGFAGSPRALSETAINSFRGKLDPTTVRDFAQTVLRGSGVDASNVTAEVGDLADTLGAGSKRSASVVAGEAGGFTVKVPASISTPSAQKKFIQDLFSELRGVVKSNGGETARLIRYSQKGAVGRYLMPTDDPALQFSWLQDTVRKELQGDLVETAGGIEVQLPKDGALVTSGTFSTTQEAYNSVAHNFFDEAMVRSDLRLQGYNLTKAKGAYSIVGPGLKEAVNGQSLEDVLGKIGYQYNMLPSRLAPRQVLLQADAVRTAYDGITLAGNTRSINKFMAQFIDPAQYAGAVNLGGRAQGVTYRLADGSIEVNIPRYASVLKFETPELAQKFLGNDIKQISGIRRITDHKGLDVRMVRGEWNVGDGKQVLKAKNMVELEAILQQYPDAKRGALGMFDAIDGPMGAEIEGVLKEIDPKLLRKWEALPTRLQPWEPNVLEEDPDLNVISKFNDVTRSIFSDFNYWRDSLKQPDLKRILNGISHSTNAYIKEAHQSDRLLMAVLRDENGKILNPDRMEAIWSHMGAQSSNELQAAQEMFGELTGGEKAVTVQLRNLLGERVGSNTTGWAAKYGETADDFINDYMPRVRSYAQMNMAEVNQMTNGHDLLHAVFGRDVPGVLSQWFDNARTEELLTFAADRNVARVLMKYSRAGLRKLYLDSPWRELDAWIKANAKSVPADVVQRLSRYREQLLGIWRPAGQDTLDNIGMSLMRTAGAKTPDEVMKGKDLMRLFFSLNYLTTMGFRPTLAIRNALQVFSTLAPRIGNEWVRAGIKKALTGGREYFDYVRSLGAIREAPPIVNEIMDSENFLAKATRKGLEHFGNADDLTRLIAFGSVDARMSEAISKFSRGIIKNDEQFIKYSGLNIMQHYAGEDVQKILDLVKAGDANSVAQAKYMFGKRITDETMFSYDQWDQPKFYSDNLITKLFGQYGTYSAGYRSNIYRGLKVKGAANKAAFITRFIGSNLAVAASMAAAGLRFQDFIPGVPALFGGGPNFDFAINLMRSFDNGPSGTDSRSALAKALLPLTYTKTSGFQFNYPNALPGSLQYFYGKKAIDYLNNGDYWKAFLAATATPTNKLTG